MKHVLSIILTIIDGILSGMRFMRSDLNFLYLIGLYFNINPLTAVAPLGTKFLKPYCYSGIDPFLKPINYFNHKKVKLLFSEERKKYEIC